MAAAAELLEHLEPRLEGTLDANELSCHQVWLMVGTNLIKTPGTEVTEVLKHTSLF